MGALRYLFVHQNFPGQFKHLAPALAAAGHQVAATIQDKKVQGHWQGVRLQPYATQRGTTPGVHPWLADFEAKSIRAEACFRAAWQLRQQGYVPDVIVAHPGWGESLFLNEVWPKARIGLYCEFFYHSQGADVGFDPEFPNDDEAGNPCRVRLKNLNNLLHFEVAHAGLSSTHWQARTFPEAMRERITVVHDGIDTDALAPKVGVAMRIRTSAGAEVTVRSGDEIVTFVNRNLEPYRGYHIFMRALPQILARRPNARVLVVGGDEVSYGARPTSHRSWKEAFIREVRPRITDAQWSRVHFLGRVPYQSFVGLLQLSSVHVYLTYPFVLSWSLLEAMSCGCAIVASDTAPVREAIHHDETGRLVGFFDSAALADEVCGLLDDPGARARLGRRAREFAREHYDLQRVCLPRQLAWVEGLAG